MHAIGELSPSTYIPEPGGYPPSAVETTTVPIAYSSKREFGSSCTGPAGLRSHRMFAPRTVDVGVACFCSAAIAALVLWSPASGPNVPWTALSAAPSVCPPAWRSGAGRNGTSQDTYQQCLARHGKDLQSGYSLQCATDCDSVLRMALCTIRGFVAWGRRIDHPRPPTTSCCPASFLSAVPAAPAVSSDFNSPRWHN